MAEPWQQFLLPSQRLLPPGSVGGGAAQGVKTADDDGLRLREFLLRVLTSRTVSPDYSHTLPRWERYSRGK